MKRILGIALSLGLLGLVAGCGGEQELSGNPPPYFSKQEEDRGWLISRFKGDYGFVKFFKKKEVFVDVYFFRSLDQFSCRFYKKEKARSRTVSLPSGKSGVGWHRLKIKTTANFLRVGKEGVYCHEGKVGELPEKWPEHLSQ